jgi:hypothetical protein
LIARHFPNNSGLNAVAVPNCLGAGVRATICATLRCSLTSPSRKWRKRGSAKVKSSFELWQKPFRVILNYVAFGMTPEEAFKAPRFSTTYFISSFG